MNSSPTPPRYRYLTLLAGTALGIVSASAATVTWTGSGPDANWDTAANWNSGVPTPDDDLTFPASASARQVNLNGDYSPLSLNITGNNDYAITGTGTLSGSGMVLEKNGTGVLTLGGANTFSGEVHINQGKLIIAATGGATAALGSGGNTVAVANGATLDLNGQGMSAQSNAGDRRYLTLELAGKGVETSPGVFAGAITSAGNMPYQGYGKSGFSNVRLNADATAHTPAGISFDLGVGGAISSPSYDPETEEPVEYTLTKTGTGNLNLGGTNTSSFGIPGCYVHVKEGTVSGYTASSFGDKVTIDSGATLRAGAGMTTSVEVVMENGAILTDFIGASTFTGSFTLHGTPIFEAANSVPLTIASALDGPADVLVRRTSGTGNVVFTNENVIDGTLNVDGFLVAAQLGNGGVSGAFKNRLGADAPVNLVTSLNGLILNRSDDFTYDANIMGNGYLQKAGSGTVRRTVAANFSRPGSNVGVIKAGTLLLNNTTGYGLAEGNVVVSENATVGGTGSVAGVVQPENLANRARAYIAPGDGSLSTGTFTVGGLSIGNNLRASLQLEINGASADKLVVNGNVTLSATALASEIAITTFGSGATQSSYTLLTYTGTFTGSFNSITGVPAGYAVRHDAASKSIVLEQSASPYDQWAAQITDPAKRGKTADADSDGIDNLTEFAFDGDPTSGTASGKIEAKTFSLSGQNAMVITIPVRTGAGAFTADANGLVSAPVDGVIYRVQGSASLNQWTLPLTEVTGTPGVTVPAAPLSSAAWEYRSFRINGPISSQPAAFLRASASE